ncbi:hypothetical protein C1645_812586 [Glomus cerebriforme]|uniref:F-box domain-containing protein n=1 Tax=Glomus cerebriforme TaxID=658196 RepID=A0A397TNP1_9GLOM|nr:hypothetical protein C1645_812586 [Glomus cerebriforme]
MSSMSNITNITILPIELLEEIFSCLDIPSLLNCLYQNHKFFSLTIPLIWKDLGDIYWGVGPKTPLRWRLISDILLSSEKTFVDYAIFVQKIDLTCSRSPEFRVSKQTLRHLLINGIRLKEINFQYHQEPSSFIEPFECLREINSSLQISTPPTTPPSSFSSNSIINTPIAPIRKVTMKLYNVSPALIISLFAKYINTLEELILQIMYELSPLPYDDLRLLVKNNQKLNYMELYTIEGDFWDEFGGFLIDEFIASGRNGVFIYTLRVEGQSVFQFHSNS